MQLVLKVSKIVSRTNWRTLSLWSFVLVNFVFLSCALYNQCLPCLWSVFTSQERATPAYFTDYISPKVSILWRHVVVIKILVRISSADLLGRLRYVSPQPYKRGQVDTGSGFSCLQESFSMEKFVLLIAAFRSRKVLLRHRRQYFRLIPYPGL